MKTTADERETVIQWSDADNGTAHVYSSQTSMMRKMAKHPKAKLVETFTDDSGAVTGVRYELPLECLRIRAGRRRVSEAQRETARRNVARAQSRSATPVAPSV